jgi:hypothetical protein
MRPAARPSRSPPPGQASTGEGRGFRAALDAASGELWLREGQGGDFAKPLYRTQARWIAANATLLGLDPRQGALRAGDLAQTLAIPLPEHGSARARARSARGLVVRGQAIAAALDALPCRSDLWQRILTAGHRAELWGEPYQWDVPTAQLRRPGTGTPALRHDRAPP